MIDLLKRKVEVGDRVICTKKDYNKLCIGTIIKVTPKKVYVAIEKSTMYPRTEIKEYNQIYKIDNEQS